MKYLRRSRYLKSVYLFEYQLNKVSVVRTKFRHVKIIYFKNLLTALDLHIGNATSIKSVATLFSNLDILCKSFFENVSLVSEFSTKITNVELFHR